MNVLKRLFGSKHSKGKRLVEEAKHGEQNWAKRIAEEAKAVICYRCGRKGTAIVHDGRYWCSWCDGWLWSEEEARHIRASAQSQKQVEPKKSKEWFHIQTTASRSVEGEKHRNNLDHLALRSLYEERKRRRDQIKDLRGRSSELEMRVGNLEIERRAVYERHRVTHEVMDVDYSSIANDLYEQINTLDIQVEALQHEIRAIDEAIDSKR